MTPEGIRVPSRAVTDMFGVDASGGELLDGGAETSIRIGGIVLKHVDDVDSAAWTQCAIAALTPASFRLPRPLAADDGGVESTDRP